MRKYKLIKIISATLLILILSFGLWLKGHYTVPILMYHYVNDAEAKKSKLGVCPETFERQMRFLRKHKYNVLPLEKLAELIKAKKKMPPKTVAVTFDDGYLDNYTNTFPVFKKYDIPVTIFVVINRVGKRLGRDDYMNWQQIKEMAESGLVTIASHTFSHPNLSEVSSQEELEKEIRESKLILEEVVGTPVSFFSYPFGGVNSNIRSLVIDSGYEAAVGTNFPKGYPSNDVYALKRIRISRSAKNLFVFWMQTSGFYTFIKERRDGN